MMYARVFAAAVLAAGLLVAGGCKNVKKRDYDAVVRENTELRERLTTLQDTVSDANSQTDDLVNQSRTLADENAKLRADLDACLAGTGGSRGSGAVAWAGDEGGFGGIEGVTGVTQRGDALAVEVAGDVLFDSGRVDLKSTAKSSLDRIASVIGSRYGGNVIRVEGYTDSDPIRKSGWKTNERLSAERAMAVEQYLVSRGVPNDRIYSAAFGPANQRGSKAQSRRVEIVILGS